MDLLTTEKRISTQLPTPFEENFIDYKNNNWYQKATLKPSKEIVTLDSLSIGKQKFELLPDTKTILGYECHKAKIIVNSNTIEVWYTNELGFKGAPSILGQNLGFVLELNRNGNYQVLATKIEKIKPQQTPAPIGDSVAVAPNKKSHASPSVRKFARELGVNLAFVEGSGPKNRILESDIQSYVKGELARPRTDNMGNAPTVIPMPVIDFSQYGDIETKPLSKIKKLSDY